MTARVDLEVTAPEASVIPLSAVKLERARASVFILDGGRAREVQVILGLSDGRSVQVVHGLEATQVVALTNVGLLADGTPVKVIGSTAARP